MQHLLLDQQRHDELHTEMCPELHAELHAVLHAEFHFELYVELRAELQEQVVAIAREYCDVLGEYTAACSIDSGMHVLWAGIGACQCLPAFLPLQLPLHLTPHMLRHGGASEAYHRGKRTLKEIQVRGRWRAFESVRRYQKQGQLLGLLQRLSSAQQRTAANLESKNLRFLL